MNDEFCDFKHHSCKWRDAAGTKNKNPPTSNRYVLGGEDRVGTSHRTMKADSCLVVLIIRRTFKSIYSKTPCSPEGPFPWELN